MCGIVGYVGRKRPALEVLLDGLRRLEYRGYDSAGVALLHNGAVTVRRALGKLSALESALRDESLPGFVGIGHTRWATHGKPSERNAHPHRAGRAVVVHNGIVENYRDLRAALEGAGCRIVSDTDTELVAHLIDRELAAGSDLPDAVRAATRHLIGSYGIAVVSESDPGRIVAAKQGGSPIILGLGDQESFLASDIPAILPYTRQIVFLQDGEFAVLSANGVQVLDADGRVLERTPRAIQWDPVSAEKGGYDRFMQKEIFEQPRAISETIGTRAVAEAGEVDLGEVDLSPARVQELERVQLIGCGTAYHACLVGKYLVEQLARIPAEADLASEYRYRRPLVTERQLVVPVSQSGETADTLAAMREAREHGARLVSVCNVRDSSIARESDATLYTHAGPEIGVASTKAFTTQLVALYLLALRLGLSRGTLDRVEASARLHELHQLPRFVEHTLALDGAIARVAHRYHHARDFLYLGRGLMYPIALEGALKLKEISYIHAEGYAAGEMKHGPIALIDEDMPVVVIAQRGPVYEKMLSNLEEVRARDGRVIAVATEGDREIAEKASDVIHVPHLSEFLDPVLVTVPLQLLAYHVAVLKGTDVDQPRNLAKSVTVE